MNKLTKNFKPHEVTRSRTADKLGIDNSIPNSHYWENALHVAHNLEIIRAAIGHKPLSIYSWFRSEELNSKIRGASKRSDHLHALAVDTHSSTTTPRQLARVALLTTNVSKVIIYDNYVHLSFVPHYGEPMVMDGENRYKQINPRSLI